VTKIGYGEHLKFQLCTLIGWKYLQVLWASFNPLDLSFGCFKCMRLLHFEHGCCLHLWSLGAIVRPNTHPSPKRNLHQGAYFSACSRYILLLLNLATSFGFFQTCHCFSFCLNIFLLFNLYSALPLRYHVHPYHLSACCTDWESLQKLPEHYSVSMIQRTTTWACIPALSIP